MSTIGKSNFIQDDGALKKAPTLVRRMSDMFKDGTYSGPPSLFRHSSMQKIRHCYQNLNILPYFLYSYENSKSHPVAKKIRMFIDLLLKKLIERILFIYTGLQIIFLRLLQQKLPILSSKVFEEKSQIKDKKVSLYRPLKEKRRKTSTVLVTAVYLTPIVLAIQLFGLGSLLISSKHTPGFIFLVTSLGFLSYIAMKIMFHCNVNVQASRKEKRKTE